MMHLQYHSDGVYYLCTKRYKYILYSHLNYYPGQVVLPEKYPSMVHRLAANTNGNGCALKRCELCDYGTDR